ncbi:permease prefix domain 1-containing protein [Phytohabitans rumicis]|uniref:Uncharacterized protein n=1 Tax=Phytohabitans rumicis TaxID=1076125 RepID=A0A6V8L8X5_9ACTN|nr:permease prefix domain 1-containing protein [Phytohabitans rumicis]GFJ91261.1 hypothetical protein Prum_049030 [Phytohabitans rumicis]
MRADAALIDDYLRTLSDQLRGPRRQKADLIAEARGSLEDAATAYQDSGLDARSAQTLAVAEFGGVGELAPAYQAELTASQGRRLALVVALVPVGMLTADWMWWQPPDVPAEAPPSAFLLMVQAIDWVSYVVGALALVALVALPSRRDPRRIVRALAAGTLVICGLIGSVGTFAAITSVLEDPRALTWPPMIAAWIMLDAVFGTLTWLAVRCVVSTRAAAAC